MKTPIPRPNPLDARVANLERLVAALVELASPDQLRKAIAAGNSRTALAEIKQAEEAGLLVAASVVTATSAAVKFREMRGEEMATPTVVVDLGRIGPDDAKLFDGVAVGQEFARKDTGHAVLEAVWDRAVPKRTHKPPKGRRGRRR